MVRLFELCIQVFLLSCSTVALAVAGNKIQHGVKNIVENEVSSIQSSPSSALTKQG